MTLTTVVIPMATSERDILSSFFLHITKSIKPKKGGHRPKALPSSSANVVRAVRRVHAKRVPPVNMVPMSAVTPILNAITKEYMLQYGYKMLLPRRREPWRRQHLLKMFAMRHQTGKLLGGLQIRDSLFWTSYFALLETLSQCGMRSSEALVQSIAEWNSATHLSRENLLWCIGGTPVVSPTPEQLDSLQDGDYAILIPPPSKTDCFGVIWGDKPMYFPVRFAAPWCAALRLRDLEKAFPLSGVDRGQAPLFCDDLHEPITYSLAYKVLNAMKQEVLTDEFDPSLFSFHSFRVYLATSLGAAGCDDATIQALCRWQSVESLRIYKRMQPEQALQLLDNAQGAVISSYTAASLPTISSYQLAAGFNRWEG